MLHEFRHLDPDKILFKGTAPGVCRCVDLGGNLARNRKQDAFAAHCYRERFSKPADCTNPDAVRERKGRFEARANTIHQRKSTETATA